ncbi:MAG: KH domain-containing protein [Atribacterota bacterium]|nr:KH domain-containing protein [Atribacterota bacterium]
MAELVEYLLKLIVDFPEKLIVKKIEKEDVIVLQITADPADLGKIIGKQGRVIKSIRTVINAATIKEKKRTIIEISEEVK